MSDWKLAVWVGGGGAASCWEMQTGWDLSRLGPLLQVVRAGKAVGGYRCLVKFAGGGRGYSCLLEAAGGTLVLDLGL